MKKGLYFGYLMILPATILMSVVSFYPLLRGIYYSFTDLKLNKIDNFRFTGLTNYINMFKDSDFYSSLGFTFLFSIGTVVLTYIVGIIIAHLLNRKIKFMKFFRVLYLFPWLAPPILVAIMWRIILNNQYGIINKFLTAIGLVESYFPFIGDPIVTKFTVIFVNTWATLPFMTIILLSALQSIPDEFYESASIDGANFFQSFFYITMPSVKNISLIVTLLVFIWTFNSAELILLLTKGGPLKATTTLPIDMYRRAFSGLDLGYGSAFGVIVVVVMMLVSIFYLKLQKE